MNDDDDFDGSPTPPRPLPPSASRPIKRLHMTDDQRAQWGAKRRTPAPVSGIPVVATGPVEVERETTDPLELWTATYSDDDRRMIDAIGLDPDGPAPLGQVVKFYNRRKKSDTARQRIVEHLANEQLLLQQTVSPERIDKFEARLNTIETSLNSTFGRARKLLWSAIGTVALSIGGVGATLWHSAEAKGRDGERLERVQDDVRRLGTQLDEFRQTIIQLLGRHSATESNASAKQLAQGDPS